MTAVNVALLLFTAASTHLRTTVYLYSIARHARRRCIKLLPCSVLARPQQIYQTGNTTTTTLPCCAYNALSVLAAARVACESHYYNARTTRKGTRGRESERLHSYRHDAHNNRQVQRDRPTAHAATRHWPPWLPRSRCAWHA